MIDDQVSKDEKGHFWKLTIWNDFQGHIPPDFIRRDQSWSIIYVSKWIRMYLSPSELKNLSEYGGYQSGLPSSGAPCEIISQNFVSIILLAKMFGAFNFPILYYTIYTTYNIYHI